jgi:hypothetical protein
MLAFMWVYNATHSLRRSPVRYFSHRRPQVRALMAEAGYEEIHDGGSPAWRVALYQRS